MNIELGEVQADLTSYFVTVHTSACNKETDGIDLFQSNHRFFLSQYLGYSVEQICIFISAHHNQHAHALTEIIDT